jgi:hypothetical protein
MNKTTTQNEPARQALRKTFSVSEFMAFGERYGIDYRFPQLLQKPEPPHASPVLRGEVEEMTLPCGMCVTILMFTYCSLMRPPPATVARSICWWCWKAASR